MMDLMNYRDLIVNVCGEWCECEVERSSIAGLEKKTKVALGFSGSIVVILSGVEVTDGWFVLGVKEICRSKGSKDVLYFYSEKGELALRNPKFVEVTNHSLLVDKLGQ